MFQSRSYECLGSDLFIAILAQCWMSIPQFNQKGSRVSPVSFSSIILGDDVYYTRKVAVGSSPMRSGAPESQDERVSFWNTKCQKMKKLSGI